MSSWRRKTQEKLKKVSGNIVGPVILAVVVSFSPLPEVKSQKVLISRLITVAASLWSASQSRTLMTQFFLKGYATW